MRRGRASQRRAGRVALHCLTTMSSLMDAAAQKARSSDRQGAQPVNCASFSTTSPIRLSGVDAPDVRPTEIGPVDGSHPAGGPLESSDSHSGSCSSCSLSRADGVPRPRRWPDQFPRVGRRYPPRASRAGMVDQCLVARARESGGDLGGNTQVSRICPYEHMVRECAADDCPYFR